MGSKVVVLISVSLFCYIRTMPTLDKGFYKAMDYLSNYGYLEKKLKSNQMLDIQVINDAIANFQQFAGLEVTDVVASLRCPSGGFSSKAVNVISSRKKLYHYLENCNGILDNETIHIIGLPRCGVKDLFGNGNHRRPKRYALQGSKWKETNISYNISRYPDQLEKEEVDVEIARAFDIWSEYSELTFTPTNGKARIDIRFEAGEHGDEHPFDGRGGTLAHAYFPAFGGDAHFDDSEMWTVKTYRGTNLFQTATHEFGHSLGLSHSNIRAAIMAPFYRQYDPTFQLHADDIQAVQNLYGARVPGENSQEENSVDSPLCEDVKFDTIFTAPTGEVYIFKEDMFWKVTRNGLAHGFPKYISDHWHGLPGNIDAAFSYRNGKTYFFKGDQYWKYSGVHIDGNYPQPISSGFPGAPNELDAAVVWSGNGKLYFFKGNALQKYAVV